MWPPDLPTSIQLALAVALNLALVACGATRNPGEGPGSTLPATPDGAREKAVFKEVLQDFGNEGGAAGLDPEVLDAQADRFAEVVAWHDAGELVSAAQRFWAGAILVRSDEPMHLVLAESLGASAALLGEHRGRLVQAEARDRTAMLLGEPQPYGTQSVFVPVTGTWRLYAVDPRTTDEERRAMGLPSLSELEAETATRNSRELTERLRKELVRPGYY
jgi:hypothetical protein